MIRYTIMTLGCKVNQYEEKAIDDSFAAYGFERAAAGSGADIFVINSCSVTAEAESKARQVAARVKRENPEAVVVLAGCYATRLGAEKLDSVDIYVNQASKPNIGVICVESLNAMEDLPEKFRAIRSAAVAGHAGTHDAGGAAKASAGTRSRAQIKIQDGCRNFCSYCIVPFIRNEEWSKPPETILGEIGDAVRAGFHEVVLTGIHLGKYSGRDMEGATVTFEDLLKMIDLFTLGNPSIRVRLSSIDPSELNERMILVMKNSAAFAPHFHVPLQSGSDRVLEAMNRRYKRELFIEKINMIAENIERPAISSDVIVGFPGETDDDFRDTYDLLEMLPFYDFHVFQYSDRPGTKATAMKDKVAAPVKKERAAALARLKKEKNSAFYRSCSGTRAIVIPEKIVKPKNGGVPMLYGHTERYVEARFTGSESLIGEMAVVELLGPSSDFDGMEARSIEGGNES